MNLLQEILKHAKAGRRVEFRWDDNTQSLAMVLRDEDRNGALRFIGQAIVDDPERAASEAADWLGQVVQS